MKKTNSHVLMKWGEESMQTKCFDMSNHNMNVLLKLFKNEVLTGVGLGVGCNVK